jgi:tetratricopeptide (TPR) repeat protein
MITVPLKLTFRERNIAPPVAWLVTGSEPSAWLAEVLAWGVSQASVRLLPIPQSQDNRQPLGVLVLCDKQPTSAARRPGYREIAPRVYIPCEAELSPAVTAPEITTLLSSEAFHIWHPSVGLVAIAEREVLGIADLVRFPEARTDDWHQAQLGIVLAPSLVAISSSEPPTVAQVIQEAGGDIGTQSKDITSLPPSDKETKPSLGSSIRKLMLGGIAKAAEYVTQPPPGNYSRPSWVSRLANWAKQTQQQLSQQDESLRNQELNRLADLLNSDPDEGLKYALPLAGDSSRGVAPPSNRLGPRNPTFDLNRLGGGGPADVWDISAELRNQLLARYRELGHREWRMNRHRRAAYIFAQLLGDFATAAEALKAGGHYREAAVIYRDRLKRPLDAAKCLDEAGLWTEAIEQYEACGQFERVGDLWRQLEQPEEAAQAYERAAELCLRSTDILNAARIYESKLDSVDRALETLALGWPHSAVASSCALQRMKLLGRLGRHVEARQQIARMQADAGHTALPTIVATLTSGFAHDYPEASVRAAATDATQRVVSQSLTVSDADQNRRLLDALAMLEPGDRLLLRDCQRYGEKSAKIKPPPSQRMAGGTLLFVGSAQHRVETNWQAAVSINGEVFAAGFRDRHVVLICGTHERWRGLVAQWQLKGEGDQNGIILVPPAPREHHLLVHPLWASEPLDRRPIGRATNTFPMLTAGGLGKQGQLLGADWVANGMLWAINETSTLVAWNSSGQMIRSHDLAGILHADPRQESYPIPLHAREALVFIGRGETLFAFNRADSDWMRVPIHGTIRTLSGSPPDTMARVVAGLDHGGVIHWPNSRGDGAQVYFSQDMERPAVALTRDGFLVAASATECEVFSTQGGQLKLLARSALGGARVIAVLPGPKPRQFLLFTADGLLSCFRVP